MSPTAVGGGDFQSASDTKAKSCALQRQPGVPESSREMMAAPSAADPG